MYKCFYVIMLLAIHVACKQASPVNSEIQVQTSPPVLLKVGAERLDAYLDLVADKRVAVVVNQTSRVGAGHLVDTLIALNVDLVKIFAPEHGFRGGADAGTRLKDSRDEKTGLPIISLYGKNKKPTSAHLQDIDIILFDIQDVGCRFYTYLSTMHLVMEACAEQNKILVVLDRPNPNGFYTDGPILKEEFSSFIGMHPIPVVHGMTLGELAQMINGEGWLADGQKCNLNVIPVEGWLRDQEYILPVAPSPNLKTQDAIYYYSSLCFFEGTIMSIGRGTEDPFTMIGHPDIKSSDDQFTPRSRPGALKPKHQDEICYGVRLPQSNRESIKHTGINLRFLTDYYKELGRSDYFLKNHFIDRLAGTDDLRLSIIEGLSSEQIKSKWRPGIERFKKDRARYLLYD